MSKLKDTTPADVSVSTYYVYVNPLTGNLNIYPQEMRGKDAIYSGTHEECAEYISMVEDAESYYEEE